MKLIVGLFFLVGIGGWLGGCAPDSKNQTTSAKLAAAVADARPLARYWWFAEEIDSADISANLDWLVDHGFGGVELAFVYPHGRMTSPKDSTHVPRAAWQSDGLRGLIAHAQTQAQARGLRCDITAGSLWPFGDPEVPWSEASQRFSSAMVGTDTSWRQPITAHWAWPTQGLVVDHLTPDHFMPYLDRTLAGFPSVSPQSSSSLFVDSWEVETRGLWADGFGESFAQRYGYRIEPHMDSLYAKGRERQRYDYHELLSERVLRFYQGFDEKANAAGYLSRGQVSGAPVDLLDGYAALDIPEGEALLYEPAFNRIPASAAAIAGKPLVSAEAFTCLYGWPRNYMRQEQVADLKLLADALFANGVNQIVWHGKPHTRSGARDSTNFYATVHLGDSSALTPHLAAFNQYLTVTSRHLRRGKPYYYYAEYLPTEDAWVAGEMAQDSQFIWAWGHYEMRYVRPHRVSGNHATLWVNASALEQARVLEDGGIQIGEQRVSTLVVNVRNVSPRAAKAISRLRRKARVEFRSAASLPGTSSTVFLPLTYGTSYGKLRPHIYSNSIGPHALRVAGDTLILFVAPQEAEALTFPMRYGQSLNARARVKSTLHWQGERISVEATGEPGEALLFEIYDGQVHRIDLGYVPPPPDSVATALPTHQPWRVTEPQE